MFGLTKKIVDVWEKKKFNDELKSTLREYEWFRNTYITINLHMTDSNLAKTDTLASFLQNELSTEERSKIAVDIGLRLLSITKTNNHLRECRVWLLGVMEEYAPVRIIFTASDGYDEEVAGGQRHPMTYGLMDQFEAYQEDIYRNYFKDDDLPESDRLREQLRRLSILYHFNISIGNIARLELGDTGNWYREYFALCVALAEHLLRGNKELSAELNLTRSEMRAKLLA